MTFILYNAAGKIDHIEDETAITVGVFDGVHRGHCDLIDQLAAFDKRLSPLVVTLTSHPAYVLGRREQEQWLDEPDEHRRLLFQAGARYVAELPFTPEVAQQTACNVATQMRSQLHMRHLLIGYDSRFGSRRDDDFDCLPQLGVRLGFSVAFGQRYLYDGIAVSSSTIRHELQHGEVGTASSLLGHPYTLHGTVSHGRGVGRTIGFPTANIDLSACRKMLPKEGVYAVRLDGRNGVANLGAAPTYDITSPSLEVHLLDFDGDLYGQKVQIEFVQRLRDTEHFASPQALQHQLQQDIISARQWL